MEFSKKIYLALLALTTSIVIFSMLLMWKTNDTSPLMYLIPGSFASFSVGTGYYFWKAKAENLVKIEQMLKKEKKESKILDKEIQETLNFSEENTSSPFNEPIIR